MNARKTLGLLVLLVLTAISQQAYAATAFLVSCRTGTSVTGQFIYIGTYQYGGQYFEEYFGGWCPQSVQVR